MNPSSSTNFFELFALPEAYDIDAKDLKQRFRDLQQEYHPDQFTSASEEQKIVAVKMSSLTNDAYQILSRPEKRAQYILSLHGVDIQQDRFIEPEILMKQLELREKFEEIIESNDAPNKEINLEAMQEELNNFFSECGQSFAKHSLADLNDPKVLQGLKQILSKMLFITKLNLELDKALEEF